MREIKFRAFHKPKKKMYDVHGLEWSVDSLVFRERRKALLGEDQHCRWHTMYLIGKDGVVEIARGHEVIADEYELMQFTGLLDKYGKEIYEGDLVQLEGDRPRGWTMIWDDTTRGWRIRFKDEHLDLCEMPPNRMTIIGNIYEHPELLSS